MADNLVRKLSQILLSKTGGNVDHSFRSVIQELIDNSLDNGANIIKIHKIIDEVNNKEYLEIYDNGDGIENIDNILLATHGKINKKGCKNQGFLDSVAYLNNIQGEVDIITNYKNNYSRISIDFTDMYKEYKNQIESDISIDYMKCQAILNNDYSKFNNKHTLIFLENDKNKNIFNKINKKGTLIKIELYKDFDEEIDNLKENLEYFQYSYNQEFVLHFMDNHIQVDKESDICECQNFIPTEFNMLRSMHPNGNEFYKMVNVNIESSYFKKTSKNFSSITEQEYLENLENCTIYKEVIIATLKFTLISDKYAKEQKKAFNESTIENLRQLYIRYCDKVIGPCKLPSNIKGFVARNLLDVRMILNIHEQDLIKDIIMTNKSQTNLDNMDKSIVKFLETFKKYLKIDYFSEIGKSFKLLKDSGNDTPGIPNMNEYIINEYQKNPKEIKKNKDIHNTFIEKEIPNEILNTSDFNKNMNDTNDNKKSKNNFKYENENIIKCDKNTYKDWSTIVYFGVLNCDINRGIMIDNGYINCHFGITNTDPKKRDSGNGLGPNWRRFYTVFVNESGSKISQGKLMIEWELYNLLKSNKKYNIIFKNNSKEYFKCKLENFTDICKIIRDKMFEFEEIF